MKYVLNSFREGFRVSNGVRGTEIIGERVGKEVVMQQYPREPVETSWMKRSRKTYGKMDHSVLSVVTRPSGETSRIVQTERFVFMLDKEMCDLYVYKYAG